MDSQKSQNITSEWFPGFSIFFRSIFSNCLIIGKEFIKHFCLVRKEGGLLVMYCTVYFSHIFIILLMACYYTTDAMIFVAYLSY